MLPKYSDIVDLIKKGATVEAQEKIMELRIGALEIQEENLALKSKVKELESLLDIKQNLEYKGQVYWRYLSDEAGDYTIRDGPFCQRCYDADQKLIRLYDLKNGWWRCKLCSNTFGKES